MAQFFVNTEELVNYTLALQKINDVALPFAVQNTLNRVAMDVKKRTLKISTQKEFDVKKKTFFTANSGYKSHKAKEFGYNINKLKAEVGITKGRNPNDTATEQVGNQQTATDIKRSINPLGNKPKRKDVIDILSKKPEIYQNQGSFDAGKYYLAVASAKKRGAPLLRKNTSGDRGSLGIVKSFKRIKKGKKAGRLQVNIKPIASYISKGYVRLKHTHPFLNNAVIQSSKERMEDVFIKEAQKQIERAISKR